ncbi:YgfZ/GcvT domain-containing protein [Luteimonas huabeiensis]|uniref:CAF17-like 4Fe-4S cluster assembly/insertion protein YgfZ n=1 Tax=Luteimonas huabeiensis TaxID=1244513 RepID=UPI00046722CD
MSDKSADASSAFFALPSLHPLAVEGRDAPKFAQAQFMNDVAALAPGHWQWNGWLTPKGRVIALFALLRLDEERFRLLLLDADAEGFAARLRGFLFRSKATVTVQAALPVSAAFAAPADASGSRFAAAGDALELDWSGDGAPRRLRLGGAAAATDPILAARWRACDLVHGLPRLDLSQAELWTPQQLSLDRLRAYSVKKGCYPGQEIVARTHFLGQAKRALARLRTAQPALPGAEVALETGGGRIVAAEGLDALAVLPLDPSPARPRLGHAPAQLLPLLEGLAR